MKRSKTTIAILTCVTAAVVFCSPSVMMGYTIFGFALGQSTSNYQRDHRVFCNFEDNAANNNSNPEAAFPGALGAKLALWKAAVAWNSQNGGNRAFESDWQGEANSGGNVNQNTSSSLEQSCGGGTLAFTENPDNSGWRIKYCEEWTWEDGPTVTGGRVDLQGVGAHEYGHAIGIGHSQGGNCNVGCSSRPTMCASICSNGVSERTINGDDRGAITDIYGSIPGNKPLITNVTGFSTVGSPITITGSNFAANVAVKFTANTTQDSGVIPGVVYGAMTTNGGTEVVVNIPFDALSGNVFVWQSGQGGLSNYWPLEIIEIAPTVSMIDPPCGQLRGGETVTVQGSNFSGSAEIFLDGQAISTTALTSTMLTGVTPEGSGPGTFVDVTVTQDAGSDTLPNAFEYKENEIAVELSGSLRAGTNLKIDVYGPANSRVAVAVGSPGEIKRLGFCFCIESPFPFVQRYGAGHNTGPTGHIQIVWSGIQGPVFTQWSVTGVIDPPASSNIQLPCESFSVLP